MRTRSRRRSSRGTCFENPGWYTPYTPYQAEIAQGRLESLLNFQTMVTDLTGMEVANASLLDEATAAAEAMTLMARVHKSGAAHTLLVSERTFPHVVDVIQARAEPLGITVKVGDVRAAEIGPEVFGVYLSRLTIMARSRTSGSSSRASMRPARWSPSARICWRSPF
jgi:glycine cleavage system pyridoxal-binding protein P